MISSEARGKRILYDDGARHMFASATGTWEHRGFLKHRIALLATAASLWAVMLFPDYGLSLRSALLVPIPAYRQSLQRLASCADIVEKVKPTVISVTARMNASGDNPALSQDNRLRDSPMSGWLVENFCGRFGQPNHGESFGFSLPGGDGGGPLGFRPRSDLLDGAAWGLHLPISGA